MNSLLFGERSFRDWAPFMLIRRIAVLVKSHFGEKPFQ
jgi:hypothetical protein